jgi:hypothetical protein
MQVMSLTREAVSETLFLQKEITCVVLGFFSPLQRHRTMGRLFEARMTPSCHICSHT